MSDALYLLQCGSSPRLETVLSDALAGKFVIKAGIDHLEKGELQGKTVLFALAVDDFGMNQETLSLVRCLRQNKFCLKGAKAAIIADGDGELYTKQAGQALVLAASMAGCTFPGKPLLEGTGSLYNQRVMSERLGLSLEDTYFARARELVERLIAFVPPRFHRPKVLMLHASDNQRSNTVALGKRVLELLSPVCDTKTISLQNGAIYDCRGCSYKACLHYSQNGTCYYGGALPTQVFPAILESDVILLLCPNYNDSASANIMALVNRMTGLVLRNTLFDKYLYSIVVSGYSGGDIVAQQILGALCLNKTMMLPGNFCFFQTANDPGSAMAAEGIGERLEQWAKEIMEQICLQ